MSKMAIDDLQKAEQENGLLSVLDIGKNSLISIHSLCRQIARVCDKYLKQMDDRVAQERQKSKSEKRDTMLSPTGGKTVRMDSKGSGKFGALRGHRFHYGLDWLCTPGQNLVAPFAGKVLRILYPYENDKHYKGIEILQAHLITRINYIEPCVTAGQRVKKGEVIGTAQDVSIKYGKDMNSHTHQEVYVNPEVLILEDNL